MSNTAGSHITRYTIYSLEIAFIVSVTEPFVLRNSYAQRKFNKFMSLAIEAPVRRCSSKLLFLKISQYSQENTHVGT